MSTPLITSPLGILAVLAGVTAFFHFAENKTGWKLFAFFPPLLFIYAVPVVLSNTGAIPNESPVYEWMSDVVLPMFLILMLLEVDVASTVRVMGRGILVMLSGTAGVVLGAPVAYLLVERGLGPEAWTGVGALAGSWIGGTGNMAAVSEGLKTPPAEFGLAVLADNLVYLVWLPILLGSRVLAPWFNRLARVDRRRIEALEQASADLSTDKGPLQMRHVLYLLFLGLFFPWIADVYATLILPELKPVLTAGSWKILVTTIFGIMLSMTRAKDIPGSRSIAAALVYLFVATMGAKASLSGMAAHAPWFLLGAFVWIALHGVFCVGAARVFHVDIHSTAIASAANIGGIASAPIVAAYHNDKLVPVSILMALLGYAIGNFGAYAAATLCYLVS